MQLSTATCTHDQHAFLDYYTEAPLIMETHDAV